MQKPKNSLLKPPKSLKVKGGPKQPSNDEHKPPRASTATYHRTLRGIRK